MQDRLNKKKPPLIRGLSAVYKDPFTDRETNADPSEYEGEEGRLREEALLRYLAWTGYAGGILERRGMAQSSLFQPAAPEQEIETDITDQEMAKSAFGQGSNVAKGLRKK